MIQSARLLELIKQYEKSDLNPRFVPAMEGLLRFNLNESLHYYSQMLGEEKKQTRRIIKDVFSSHPQLCKYVSKRKILKFIMNPKTNTQV